QEERAGPVPVHGALPECRERPIGRGHRIAPSSVIDTCGVDDDYAGESARGPGASHCGRSAGAEAWRWMVIRCSPGTARRPSVMKLALYLPNFRDKVTVEELEDLTALAEELDFDSVWTLDRIVVPESSDRGELTHPFGMMMDFPPQMPVIARG